MHRGAWMKKEGDHLLARRVARVNQLHVRFIMHHFMALPPIFDHKQGPNFDLIWARHKEGRTRSSRSALQSGESIFKKFRIFFFLERTVGLFCAISKEMAGDAVGKMVWNNSPLQSMKPFSLPARRGRGGRKPTLQQPSVHMSRESLVCVNPEHRR